MTTLRVLEIHDDSSPPIGWSDQVRPLRCRGLPAARVQLARDGVDVVALHAGAASLPRALGLAAAPVVVVDPHPSIERAVECIAIGAANYVAPKDAEAACREASRLPAEARGARRASLPLYAHLVESETLATVGRLAAGAAHAINNPAAIVVANLDNLAEDVANLDALVTAALDALRREARPAVLEGIERLAAAARAPTVFQEAREMLSDCLDGMRRIRDIVRDLRGLSVGHGETMVPVDMRRVLESALELVGTELPRGLEVERSLDEVPPVMGSPGRLAQVLLQLLLNAAQSFEGTRRQPGQRRSIRVRCFAEGDDVVVLVEDNGRGIPEAELPLVFDPFFSTRPAGKGAGIGLPLSRAIVQRHSGELRLHSREGRGTRVVVRLPAAGEAGDLEPLEAPGAQQDDPLSRASILVVDDEPALVRCIERLLRAAREVHTCTSGAEAIERMKADPPPDLVLCDLKMTDISGVDIYERIRRERPEMAGRILFVTGGAFTERTRRFCEEHFDVIIEKPFESAAFRQRVRAALLAGS